MTKTEAINKVIQIAQAEVGYLEKRSNSNLDSKTANAGSNNYTKYWRDIEPSYQAQPWCAAFVSWVLMRAFGQDAAKKLLKHWPYVYVPTLAGKFTWYANPQVGDIVMFYRGGTFTHTGIVTSVSGDYFTTIEGNTSGGSSIIANGGGVCSKGYYNSNLPGTKFARLDWSIVAKQENSNNQQPEKPEGGKYMFEPENVQMGSKGTSTLLLQEILKARGIYKGNLDGDSGSQTVAAINAYQSLRRKQGVEVGTNGRNDGCCGPAMWRDLIGI